jgi:hypothetical protein
MIKEIIKEIVICSAVGGTMALVFGLTFIAQYS